MSLQCTRLRHELSWSNYPAIGFLLSTFEPDLLGHECRFEYHECVAGLNVFVNWHIVEVYLLPGTVRAALYPQHPPWWP